MYIVYKQPTLICFLAIYYFSVLKCSVIKQTTHIILSKHDSNKLLFYLLCPARLVLPWSVFMSVCLSDHHVLGFLVEL